MNPENRYYQFTMFYITVLIVSSFLFLYKINACTSSPSSCHDEYYSSDYLASGHQKINCDPGAVAEVIKNAHGDKEAIRCHCVTLQPVASGSAEPAASANLLK